MNDYINRMMNPVVPVASEQAGTEIRDSIIDTYNRYGIAATHMALLTLIDELYELDECND